MASVDSDIQKTENDYDYDQPLVHQTGFYCGAHHSL
jgi:hypothetical protein